MRSEVETMEAHDRVSNPSPPPAKPVADLPYILVAFVLMVLGVAFIIEHLVSWSQS